jgi:trk system potassium uptake protein TrkH
MTATLLSLMVNRSSRLRARLMARTELRSLGPGDVCNIAWAVLVVTILPQSALALVVTLRLHCRHGPARVDAGCSGRCARSAFNNASLSIHADGLVRYAGRALILPPIMLGFMDGGIGFPVQPDLRQRRRNPRHCRSTPSSR